MKPRSRGKPKRQRRTESIRTIVVFCEGSVTEDSYLSAWRRQYRSEVNVEIAKEHGVPKTLVGVAAQRKRDEQREAHRGGGRAADEYWCVFDIDEHEVAPAFDQANANGIRVAVTNPCIELWFILHLRIAPRRSIGTTHSGGLARFSSAAST